MAVTATITAPASAVSGSTVSVSVAFSGDTDITVVEIIESMPASTAGELGGWANLIGKTGGDTAICPIILNSGNTSAFNVTLSVVLRMSSGAIVVPSTDTISITPGPLPAAPG